MKIIVPKVNIYTYFIPRKTRKARKDCVLIFLYSVLSVLSVLSVVKSSLEIGEGDYVLDDKMEEGSKVGLIVIAGGCRL